jgi:hypothetical protein
MRRDSVAAADDDTSLVIGNAQPYSSAEHLNTDGPKR